MPPIERGSPQWHARREAHLRDGVGAGIRARGWVVQPIQGSSTVDGYQYTIGLTDHGIPELVLGQFYPPIGAFILNALAKGLIAVMPGHARLAVVKVPMLRHADRTFDFVEFRFGEPGPFDSHMYPAIAHDYYKRIVDHLVVTTAGWPCHRCAMERPMQPCICEFSCAYMYCRHGDRPVLGE